MGIFCTQSIEYTMGTLYGLCIHHGYAVWSVHTPWVLCTKSIHTPWVPSVWSIHAPPRRHKQTLVFSLVTTRRCWFCPLAAGSGMSTPCLRQSAVCKCPHSAAVLSIEWNNMETNTNRLKTMPCIDAMRPPCAARVANSAD